MISQSLNASSATTLTANSIRRNRSALKSQSTSFGKKASSSSSSSFSPALKVRANGGLSRDQEMMGGLGGDIGARDPTAGEIGSNFGTSTLGHADTDHIVKASGKGAQKLMDMTMLKNRPIQELPADATACTLSDGEKFAARCQAVASEAGWPVETTVTGEKVVVEAHTKEVKGLTINDFIVATKIEADEEIAAMIVKKAKAARNWI